MPSNTAAVQVVIDETYAPITAAVDTLLDLVIYNLRAKPTSEPTSPS